MFLPFFDNLRNAGVPVSLREFLAFLEAMKKGLATYDIEAFYYLARAIMVKDERHLDKFDRAFSATFSGLDAIPPPVSYTHMTLTTNDAAQTQYALH